MKEAGKQGVWLGLTNASVYQPTGLYLPNTAQQITLTLPTLTDQRSLTLKFRVINKCLEPKPLFITLFGHKLYAIRNRK